ASAWTAAPITNDLPAGLQLRSLTVEGTYKMNGNSIALGEGGLYDAMGVYVSILENNLYFSGITLAASQTWNSPARALRTVVGPTNVNGKTLTLNIAPVLIVNAISGDGAIVQTGGSTSVGASTFTGAITVSGGTFDLAGSAGGVRASGGALELFGASV